MQKPRPLALLLSVIFIVVVLGGLAARFWATHMAAQASGPTHLAVSRNSIFVYAAGSLYQLALTGKLLAVLPLATSGLEDAPIDLRVLPGGELLIAGQSPASMRICTTDTWGCRTVPVPGLEKIQRQFKVIPGRGGEEWLISDARGDTLWKFRPMDEQAIRQTGQGVLAGPNDLLVDRSGRLWIADTDKRRILELSGVNGNGYSTEREHGAVNSFTVGNRHYPMMLALDSQGLIWVTQGAEFSQPHADVLIYDPQAGAIARIDLPDGAYATDIAAAGQNMLVTDMDRFAVYKVDAASRVASTFGDKAFRRHLSGIQSRRDRFERLSTAALAVIVLGALLILPAVLLTTPRGQRWTPLPRIVDFDNTPDRPPAVKGIHWLERNVRLDRSIKWLEYLGAAVFVVLAACSVVAIAWIVATRGSRTDGVDAAQFPTITLMLLCTAMLAVFLLVLMRFTVRAMKHRLGTDGTKVYVRLHNGRELVLDPAVLSYTRRALFYRHYTLPLLGSRQQSVYAAGEVETWLGPLLRKASLLTEWQALKHQFRHRDAVIIWPMAALALVGGLILLVKTVSG